MTERELKSPINPTRTWSGKLLTILVLIQAGCQTVALPVVILYYGLTNPSAPGLSTLQWLTMFLSIALTAIPLMEWQLSKWHGSQRPSFFLYFLVSLITLIGLVFLFLFGSSIVTEGWLHLGAVFQALVGLLSLFRRISLIGWSPGLILVLSFVSMIICGTLLLMLPRCHAENHPGDLQTALFTATSAVCVTGLNVVPTTVWSREGQIVLLVLIQFGGLGLMTCGAAFALLVRRGLVLRERAILGDLFERKVLDDLKRLIVTIVVFTLTVEIIGAIFLSGLWSDMPLGEQIFYSLFHSVSAFCNAGFSLQPDSMVDYARTWQVLGVMPVLIILGGLGFVVIYDLGEAIRLKFTRHTRSTLFHHKEERARLTLTTKIVVVATVVLLLLGTLVVFVLESSNPNQLPWHERLEVAWFHSVSSRTAGFNTFGMGQLNASTLFFLALLMGIGASPGSTGGGMKTVPVVVCLLTLRALMRGRSRVEIGFRTIPTRLVFRALTIVTLGLGLMIVLTLLVVALENRPDRFLDHLFEVVSALATVGLSTGVTAELTSASKSVLMLAMFMGRVGPLTLIVSVAGRESTSAYRYPDERVLLG